ncbi:diguanylate cyclase domain-containing protein [Solicola sp. PLA-1-18]|uniref:GGDEF domain-containing protein n=1 Tax=Solicola sp. PLA-1-18 TaxID=3380532 RepID=UPI003B7E8B3D
MECSDQVPSTLDDALWVGLSDLERLVRDGDDLVPMFAAATRAAAAVPGALDARLSRIDWQAGVAVEVARCDAAALDPDAPEAAVGRPLADVPHAARAAAAGRGAVLRLDDADLSADERAMLETSGGRLAYSSPVQVGTAVWGTLTVCLVDEGAEAVGRRHGDLVTSLLAQGLTRLERLAALHEMAFTDPLTGIANRRAAEDLLDRYIHDPDLPDVSLVLLDVDHFKQVNDSRGHDGGDRLLRVVALTLRQVAAGLDGGLAARLGGDEFALVARTSRGLDVADVVGTLRDAVRPSVPTFDISTGAAVRGVDVPVVLPADEVRRALMRSADADLYRHKQSRRAPSAELAGQHWTEHVYDSLAELTQSLQMTPDAPPSSRLRMVAEAVCAVTEAATWMIGRTDGDGQLHDDVFGYNPLRRTDDPPVPLGSYDLADFPATRAALAGYPFFATVIEGDVAERRVLATTPFTAVVGAGGHDRDGTGWLVEIYADDFSGDVSWATSTLQVLVTLALG